MRWEIFRVLIGWTSWLFVESRGAECRLQAHFRVHSNVVRQSRKLLLHTVEKKKTKKCSQTKSLILRMKKNSFYILTSHALIFQLFTPIMNILHRLYLRSHITAHRRI